jgi:drug/metabolite transporter (DMT)-like permease
MSAGADESRRALAAASIAVVVWGFGPLFIRGIDMSAGALVFWRFLISLPIMTTACYVSGGRLRWVIFRRMAIPATLFALSFISSFLSYQKTSIVNASLIGSLEPALLLLVAPFIFHVRTTARQVGFGAIALAGVVALVLGAGATNGSSYVGDLWAVVTLVLWTVYFIWAQRVRSEGYDALSMLAAVFIISFVVTTPITLTTSHDVGSVTWKAILLLTLQAVGPGLVGHGMMMWSQRHLDIRTVSLMGLATPVVSAFGAWIVFSQGLRWMQFLGAAAVLAGLAGIVGERPAPAVRNADAVVPGTEMSPAGP